LELDFYIRLPESIPDSRLATLSRPSLLAILRGFGLGFFLVAFNRRSNIARALMGSEFPRDEQHIYARNFEVPSGGASARRAPSPTPTACSRLADTRCGYGQRRWTRWRPRRFRQRTASTTSAC